MPSPALQAIRSNLLFSTRFRRRSSRHRRLLWARRMQKVNNRGVDGREARPGEKCLQCKGLPGDRYTSALKVRSSSEVDKCVLYGVVQLVQPH